MPSVKVARIVSDEQNEQAESNDVACETPDIASSSDDYARRFRGSVGDYFLRTQAQTVLQMLAGRPTARILDVGGGHAQLALPLARAGYRVTIVGSRDSCRQRLDQVLERREYDFVTGNLLELPFQSDTFDVVLAFRMLPHLRDWQKLIAECCRTAAHTVILDYPDSRSVNVFSTLLFGAKRKLEGNTRPFRCFRRHHILCELNRHGFCRQQLRPQFLFPMALHRGIRVGAVAEVLEGAARFAGLTRIFGSPVIVRAEREDATQ